METRSAALACYFNLVTVMSQINLSTGTPLDYLRELIWDNSLQQDRFFAWADRKLIDEVNQAAREGQFNPEPSGMLLHSGVTRQWKHVQLGEVNLQLAFHETQLRVIKGTECVIVEPDFDYYKSLVAHALLEVITNAATQSLTDPRQVYALRWIAGRRAGLPEFDPPYFLD
jgi:hypothetical protein